MLSGLYFFSAAVTLVWDKNLTSKLDLYDIGFREDHIHND